jgi:hypothetical protein
MPQYRAFHFYYFYSYLRAKVLVCKCEFGASGGANRGGLPAEALSALELCPLHSKSRYYCSRNIIFYCIKSTRSPLAYEEQSCAIVLLSHWENQEEWLCVIAKWRN